MIVAGIDPGLSVGVATYNAGRGALDAARVIRLNDLWHAGERGQAAQLLRADLREFLAFTMPDVVCIEEPQASHARDRRGKGKSIGISREQPFAIMTWAELFLSDLGIPYYVLPVNTIRKAALGRGNLSKEDAHAAMPRLGLTAPNVHTRDALIAAVAGAAHHRVVSFRAGLITPVAKRAGV